MTTIDLADGTSPTVAREHHASGGPIRFAAHVVEMLVVMPLGMTLGGPLGISGVASVELRAVLWLLVMTIPMVAWMSLRAIPTDPRSRWPRPTDALLVHSPVARCALEQLFQIGSSQQVEPLHQWTAHSVGTAGAGRTQRHLAATIRCPTLRHRAREATTGRPNACRRGGPEPLARRACAAPRGIR